jgi:hypothetical protein
VVMDGPYLLQENEFITTSNIVCFRTVFSLFYRKSLADKFLA